MTIRPHDTAGPVATSLSVLRPLADGVHPALPLIAFPAALLLDTMLSVTISSQAMAPWVLRVGLLIGSLMAVAIPFLLWVYFVVSIYLILTVLGQMVDLRKLGDIVAVAFLFATVGKLIECVLRLAGLTAIAPWPYVALALLGLAVTTYGAHVGLKVPKADAFLSVVLSLIALESVFFVWTRWP